MNQVKKVKHLRLAFTVCGMALALGAGSTFVINATNSLTVHAAEVQLDANSDFARLAPTTVNYTVHKGMTLLGKTQASVVDDGNAQSWNNDTTDFDPAKYGKVGYTAYDITNTIESGDMTGAGLKTIGDDIAKDPTGNYYIKNAQTKTAEQFITSGSTTTFKNLAASDANSEHHVWAIIETTHPKGLVTQISQPIIVALPLTNTAGTAWQTESNGFPKNIVQQLKFTLTKHGDSPSGDGKTSYLPGIPFQLYTGKPGSGKATGTVVKTDANGSLTVSGLVRGDYYFVEESSSDVADIDSDSDATYLLGADVRNDSANKLTFSISEDGVDPSTLHADVMNYHAPDMQKTLEDDHNSFTEGTLADFKTAIHIPNDINGGTGSEIAGQSYITEPYGVFEGTDTADAGLTWNRAEANFKATIDINSNGKVDDGDVTLKEGTDYTLTDLADGRGYKIQFIVNHGKVSNTVAKYQGGDINLTYSEVIHNDAVIDSALYNTFDLGYQNHPLNVGKQHTRHIKHKVPVYTYGARFTKQSSGLFGTGIARMPLEGAQFVVQNADGKFFNGFKDGADDDAIAEAQWVDKATDVTAGILTSDKDGNFAIKGLIAGNYVLQEVKAPTGYELNNHSQKFVVGPNTYTNTVYVASDDAKPTLPNTGSNEFKAMVAISIVVIAGVVAISVYEVKKRKAA